MAPRQLAKALGFKTGVPPTFNPYRHRSGISPWDDAESFEFAPDQVMPAYLETLKLHWHQLAGVHSILRSIFTKEKDPAHTNGVLIGDEVGLGKTAQSIAVLAFLNQVIYLQSKNATIPPIIGESLLRQIIDFSHVYTTIPAERPFLMGSRKIPSLPHLILCPGTLVAQWVSELKILLMPRTVDIAVYDSQVNGSWFWGPNGPPSIAKHKSHFIVVATHSVSYAPHLRRYF